MPDVLLAGIVFAALGALAGLEWHSARRQRRHDRAYERVMDHPRDSSEYPWSDYKGRI